MFSFIYFDQIHIKTNYKTPLFIAVENNNLEIAQLLLYHPKIDVNMKSILNND